MKKLMLVIAAAALFTSCKKNWSCMCVGEDETIDGFSDSFYPPEEVEGISRVNASGKCKTMQSLFNMSLDKDEKMKCSLQAK